jgi:hypothetical protein
MFRNLFVALCVLLLGAGGLRAEDRRVEGYRATLQKIDVGRNVIVVKSGDRERPIKVGMNVVLRDEGGKDIPFEDGPLGEKGFKEGRSVTVSISQTKKEAAVVIRLVPERKP